MRKLILLCLLFSGCGTANHINQPIDGPANCLPKNIPANIDATAEGQDGYKFVIQDGVLYMVRVDFAGNQKQIVRVDFGGC